MTIRRRLYETLQRLKRRCLRRIVRYSQLLRSRIFIQLDRVLLPLVHILGAALFEGYYVSLTLIRCLQLLSKCIFKCDLPLGRRSGLVIRGHS